MRDVEKETRDRLIDAARTHLIVSAAGQTGLAEAPERLSQQAYGNADRLRGAAEQLRRRFAGAEAISLLEAAAEHAEGPTKPEPPVLSDRLDSSDTRRPHPQPG
jgi:hypothetical protein